MSWLTHFRYAARVLRKRPLFASIAVASLALGIGANVAIFSLLDQILFRSLPVRDPGRLVLLQSANAIASGYHGDSAVRLFSYPMYIDLRDGLRGGQTFDGLIAECPIDVSLSGPGQAEAASGELVSGNLFGVLGVDPALGRLLAPPDDAKSAAQVAVLGHGFWTRHFGADPGVIGSKLRLNGTVITVIGVAPKRFYGVSLGPPPDIYLPLSMQEQTSLARVHREDRNQHWLHILGRLKNGIGLARRTREIGIRMALGAGRIRVLRMVLREVALLCGFGIAVGLPAAVALARLARSQLYGVGPADPVTLAASAALMLAVALAAAFLPARRAARIEPTEALRYE